MKTGLESLDTGAPEITYSGNQGPKSPQEDQQKMAEFELQEYMEEFERVFPDMKDERGTPDYMKELQDYFEGLASKQEEGVGSMAMKSGLIDEYRNYKMGQEEAGEQFMSPRDYYRSLEQDRMGAAGGGIMNNKKIKGQDHMLAYITPNEAEKLKALGGQETMTKEGIPAYPEFDNYGFSSQADFDSGDVSKSNDPNVRGTAPGQNRVTAQQLAATNAAEKKAEADRIEKERRAELTIREKIAEYNKNYKEKQKERYTVSKINELNKKLGNVNVDFFGDTEETYGDIIGANAPSVMDFGPEGTGKYSQEFIDDVLSGKRAPPESFSPIDISKVPGGLLTKGLATGANIIGKAIAGPTTKEELMDIYSGNKTGNSFIGARDLDVDKMTGKEMMEIFEPNRYAREYGPQGGDGPPIILPYPTTTGMTTEDPEKVASVIPYRGDQFLRADNQALLAADGGRIGYAGGGITDLRQGYFLGKLVKKAVRGIKKVVKSPVGKAALMAAPFFFPQVRAMIPGGTEGYGSLMRNKKGFMGSFFNKLLRQKNDAGLYSSFDPFKVGIAGLSALTYLKGKQDEDDEPSLDEYMKTASRGPSMDPRGIRDYIAANKGRVDPNQYAFLQPNFYAADGGRIDYANGGIGELRGALSKEMFGYDDDEDDVKKLAMGGSTGLPPVTMQLEGTDSMSFPDDESTGMPQATPTATLPNQMPRPRPIMDSKIMQQMMMASKMNPQMGGRMNSMMGNRMMAAMGGRMGFADGGANYSFGFKPGKEFQLNVNSMGKGTIKEIINSGELTSEDLKAAMDALRNRKAEGGMMDMGGLEKDYRNDGGFVPIGGQERADDVPARLSKNEFVFTADAVRNAGGGDIDKGAEIMENMMENLENGGKVSQGSQGLDGAREMFATQQRLGEVL